MSIGISQFFTRRSKNKSQNGQLTIQQAVRERDSNPASQWPKADTVPLCQHCPLIKNDIKWTTTQSEAIAGFEPSSLSANDRCGTALPSIVHWPKAIKWTTQRGATGRFETRFQVVPDRCATALLMYCPLASLISSSLKKDRQPQNNNCGKHSVLFSLSQGFPLY